MAFYPNYYYPQYQPQIPQQPAQFVRVRSEHEARMWPVAPGNSITFIDENAPYCYTKTVDMSQLDRPRFERYRLVKEDVAQEATGASARPVGDSLISKDAPVEYALKSELDGLQKQVEKLERRINDESTHAAKSESDSNA